jgi:dTDP-4-amino-4,6-dideoxygalactose transaminase
MKKNTKNFISYVNIGKQYQKDNKILGKKINKLLNSGIYIGGDEVSKFEKNIAKKCGTKYAVAMNSGTDALTVGMYLLGVKRGDEVITPANSFVASTSTIVHLGAKPVFADVLYDLNINPDEIGRKVNKKTKLIMPVHLTGRIAEMNEIKKISKKWNIPIIEDSAQAVGSLYKGKPSGSLGDIGCFSAHPLKNLNACGDSGYMTTNNYRIYLKAKSLINHGMNSRNVIKNFGYLSRMDNLQALILNHRLKSLNKVIKKRRENARFYNKELNKYVATPNEKKYEFNTYHTYIIQTKLRDELKEFLKKNNVETVIHYPIPIHLQPAAKYLGYKKGDLPITEKLAKNILTLPIHQNLEKKQRERVVFLIKKFFEDKNLF